MARVALGYVHPGSVSHLFMNSVLRVLNSKDHELVIVGHQSGANISTARNEIAWAFKDDTDADYLWFVDTDIDFPPETLQKLIDRDKDVVSALYLGLHVDGRRFPVALRRGANDQFDKLPMKAVRNKKGLIKVDGIGMGCVLIKRAVIEAVGCGILWPFAETFSSENQPLGEDTTFSVRVVEKGFQLFLDLDTRVGHLKPQVLI